MNIANAEYSVSGDYAVRWTVIRGLTIQLRPPAILYQYILRRYRLAPERSRMLVVIGVAVWLQSGVWTSRFLTVTYIGIFHVTCSLRPLLELPRPPAVQTDCTCLSACCECWRLISHVHEKCAGDAYKQQLSLTHHCTPQHVYIRRGDRILWWPLPSLPYHSVWFMI
jgi:hypothetical protein